MAACDVANILFIVISVCAQLLVSSSRPLASSVYDVRDYGAIGDGNSDDTKLLVSSSRHLASSVYNVRDYGAIGDGNSDDTEAFMKAWEATCKSSSLTSATMVVPSTMTFLVHPLYFEGRCNPNHINFEIYGNIVAPKDPSAWRCEDGNCDQWIHFKSVDNLSVYGSGIINGQGEKWWEIKHRKKPSALEISHSNNVRLSDLTFKNNPRMHVVLSHIDTLHVSNITIDAPGDSPNTDGIHISGCTNVLVDNCTIATGDDCISIVNGSSNLRISNIICGPGHGVSIGSLGKHGATDKVEYIHVSDVVFKGSTNGARIKTWQGGSGYARHILFERILSQRSGNPIIIDQFYCDHEDCGVTHESAVKVSNVTFREVIGVPVKKSAIILDCSATLACTDITLEKIDLRLRDGSEAAFHIRNAYGRIQGEVAPRIPLSNQR